VLLFGAKKLPDAARGLGRSLRIFKAETKGLRDDDEPADEAPRQSLPPAQNAHQNVQPGPQVAAPLEHDIKRDRA
jgi:sec-independent protein translocase protein TatA